MRLVSWPDCGILSASTNQITKVMPALRLFPMDYRICPIRFLLIQLIANLSDSGVVRDNPWEDRVEEAIATGAFT